MYFTPRQYPFRALDSDARDVIVAGGGPVGLAAALGLARRGVAVTVLEDGDSACYGSRAINISRHSLEVLDRLGAGAALAARALPWTTGRSYYRDTEVLQFDMPQLLDSPRPGWLLVWLPLALALWLELDARRRAAVAARLH